MTVTAHIKDSLRRSAETLWWLVKVMVPASAVVFVLEYTGILARFSVALAPITRILGLPGEAALVFLTSILINLYSVIAVVTLLELTVKELLIISLVCLIAHNYLIEMAVTRRTGTPVWRMFILRTGAAFIVGFIVAHVVPETPFWTGLVRNSAAGPLPVVSNGGLIAAGSLWFREMLSTLIRIGVIITILTVGTRLLHAYGVMNRLAAHLKLIMHIFGLPRQTGPAWIVANTLGLAYGAAVLIEEVEAERFTLEEGDLLNHHLGVSHSLLEDTALFAAIGAPVLWLIVPRLAIALVAVWARRLELYLHRLRHDPVPRT
jgi:spore maturation protein SpmB